MFCTRLFCGLEQVTDTSETQFPLYTAGSVMLGITDVVDKCAIATVKALRLPLSISLSCIYVYTDINIVHLISFPISLNEFWSLGTKNCVM